MTDTTTRQQVDFSEVVARYGTDLAVILSHLPQDQADAAIDDLAAGVKEGADKFREARLARLRQGIG